MDDSLEFLKSASNLLGREKRVELVGQASSAAQAVNEVAAARPDLVLMDLNMPDMNGLEATRLIKKQQPSPHVVILTLHDNAEYRAAALASGAIGFISKIEFTKDFLALMRDLLERMKTQSNVGPISESAV